MDKIKYGVTAWVHPDEWKHVAQLVIAREEEKALEYFRVWRSRVFKLPVGVYITLALIEDVELENRFSLGMAVSRFFDHLSHIGSRHFYGRDMHLTAENLQIPSWIVDVRHACIHKEMPSIHELRLAYETCYAWIVLNYWHREKENALPDLANHELYDLLDLYLYLKIYKEWGTYRVSDIAKETEIFGHISRLWNSYVKNGNLMELNTLEALERVNHVLIRIKIIPRELITTLVDEDLIVPQQDFLNALVKQDALDSNEDPDEVKIPATLLAAWKQIIIALDAKCGAKVLFEEIVRKIQDESVDETKKEYFAAWIVELSEAMLGRSEKLSLREDHGCTLQDLETWLAVPNSLIETLLPCFCSLAGVTKEKYLMLQQLISAGTSNAERGPSVANDDYQTHTLDDLTNEKEEKTDAGNTNKRWKHEKDSYWSSERLFKLCHGQTWESLWLPETVEWEQPPPKTNEQETEESEAASTSNYMLHEEDVGLAIWPNMELAPINNYNPPPPHVGFDDTNVPHFYRNTAASSAVPHFYRNTAASSTGHSDYRKNSNYVPLGRQKFQVVPSQNQISSRRAYLNSRKIARNQSEPSPLPPKMARANV